MATSWCLLKPPIRQPGRPSPAAGAPCWSRFPRNHKPLLALYGRSRIRLAIRAFVIPRLAARLFLRYKYILRWTFPARAPARLTKRWTDDARAIDTAQRRQFH